MKIPAYYFKGSVLWMSDEVAREYKFRRIGPRLFAIWQLCANPRYEPPSWWEPA